MARTEQLFATTIYRAPIARSGNARLVRELVLACRAIAANDRAGQAWARRHRYAGYTSYASLDDLAWRDPVIAELVTHLDGHAANFARAVDMDLAGRRLRLDSLWINVLEPGGMHAGHIHPQSVVSGTCYVALPKGVGGLKFEDPRLGLMMAAPARRARAARRNRSFVEIAPKAGEVLLWESWLRHEVPPSRARAGRISISFNYGWR